MAGMKLKEQNGHILTVVSFEKIILEICHRF